MGIFKSSKKRRSTPTPENMNSNIKNISDEKAFVRWSLGDRIQNRYEVREILGGPGKSGMGIVYICYDIEWHGMFAIKTFQDKYLWDHDIVNRFFKEAEIWVDLEKHTNIVFANSVLKILGKPYIFLEYIDGGDLSQYIGKIDISHALDYAIQLCNGMIYAYNKLGIIHRDIKPQNAMITSSGILKVTDFGLVKALRGKSLIEERDKKDLAVSRGGGTPAYMPPEQFDDEIQKRFHLQSNKVTTRSDIYSFGATFYQILTGCLPFFTLEQIFTQKPVNPSKINDDIPRELDFLIMKCLEKYPNDRYKNFEEIIEKLKEIYNRLPIRQKIFGESYLVKGKEEPLNPVDLYNKGLSLEALRRYNEAITCFDKMIDMDIDPSQHVYPLGGKGNSLAGLGRYLDAVACYDKALKINPRDAMVWHNKGKALADLERFEEAILCYEKALDIKQNDPVVASACLNGEGVIFSNQGKYEEAQRCYRKALEINPRNDTSWAGLGIVLNNLGKYEESLSCYEKGLEINPTSSEIWTGKALSLIKLQRYEEAIVCAEKSIKVDQKNENAWINKGTALLILKNLDEASICFDNALEINSKNCNALLGKGTALRELKRFEEAITYYDKALNIDPSLSIGWSGKGVCLRALQKYQEANNCFNKALQIDQTDKEAWLGKGYLLGTKGDYQEAINCFDKALKTNTKNVDAWFSKGLAFEGLEKYKDALTCYEKALEINSKNYQIWHHKGRVLHNLRRYQDALYAFEEAIELDEGNTQAWYDKGLCFANLGRHLDAFKCFKRFLELAPPELTTQINAAKEFVREVERQLSK